MNRYVKVNKMDKNRITIEGVMALDPCMSEKDISDYFNGRDCVTYIDVIEDKHIKSEHKLWLLCHCLDDNAKMVFALKCAEDALPLFEAVYPEDNRPRSAIEAAKRCIAGQCTRGELSRVIITTLCSSITAANVASTVVTDMANIIGSNTAACNAAHDANVAATRAAKMASVVTNDVNSQTAFDATYGSFVSAIIAYRSVFIAFDACANNCDDARNAINCAVASSIVSIVINSVVAALNVSYAAFDAAYATVIGSTDADKVRQLTIMSEINGQK